MTNDGDENETGKTSEDQLNRLYQAIIAANSAGNSWATSTANVHRLAAAGDFLQAIQALLAKDISPNANKLLDALLFWVAAYALGHEFPLIQREKRNLSGQLNMTELSWRAYFRVAYDLLLEAEVPQEDAIRKILSVAKKHGIPLPEGKKHNKEGRSLTDGDRLLYAIENFNIRRKSYITTDTAQDLYNKTFSEASRLGSRNGRSKLQTALIFLEDVLPSLKEQGFTSV